MENIENSKPTIMQHLAFENPIPDQEIFDSRPSIEWFQRAPDSPFKRGIPRSLKKKKSENIAFLPVNSSPLKDTLDSNPSLDTPLHAQFLASLAQPKSVGSRLRTTTVTEERLEFFGNEEWAEVLSPMSVRCKACGKTYQLNPRVSGGYYPLQWIVHRKKCAGMYSAWLCVRGKTDEAWFYTKKCV
ncbi:hypothetical protein IW261DRAFT_1611526 [Armillaria novae-zelandiae]|uniref:Uncharacterized protein n=1 Tax=Armillaria novae-zelandiae TaxID=153914 RepID=A0AA39NVI0_9AGAR|nr:hypothetical protein IW261DRAFT_1611526 [Armillaria novae-zelandiae]